MSTKRAQVTLFIILGVIVLLSVLLYFVFRSGTVQTQLGGAPTQTIPSEFSPLRPYIESCLEEVAIDSLERAGRSGGYIDTSPLYLGVTSWESDAVHFTPSSDTLLPYWHHLASPTDCTSCSFRSEALPLRGPGSIEEELENAIDEDILTCLGTFSPLRELGYEVTTKGRPKTDVEIAARDTVVRLAYPITATRNDERIDEDEFLVRLDLDLERLYDFARYLATLQEDYRFLERATLNFLSGFSGRDRDKLPPMTDMSFELGGGVTWSKRTVERDVRDMLVSSLPLLRVQDTPGYEDIVTTSRYQDMIYARGLTIPNNASPTAIDAELTYLDFWGMHFDLNCDGDVCAPQNAISDLLPIGMQRYQFAYDLSFPVMVELTDASAFGGQGYRFRYLLEANIRNNHPLQADGSAPPGLNDIRDDLLCDVRTSGVVTIDVQDAYSLDPLDGVAIHYSCLDTCAIGSTERGVLADRYPVCIGGALTLQKDGYRTAILPLDTFLEQPGFIETSLLPELPVAVSVKKAEVQRLGGQWQLLPELVSLEENESAFVELRSGERLQLLEVGPGESETVDLSEGEWEITVTVLTDKPYRIPAGAQTVEGVPIPEEDFTQDLLPTGSFSYSQTITRAQLTTGHMLLGVLNAELHDVPEGLRTIDDLGIVSDLPAIARLNEPLLKPDFP